MSKTRMGKRVASLLLSLVMMLSLLPTTVYATEDTGGGTGATYDAVQQTESGDNTENTGKLESTGEGEDDSEAGNNTEGTGELKPTGEDKDGSEDEQPDGADNMTSSAAAEVNGTGYETLAAAINAANTGDTVTLLADVNLDSAQTISKQLTIDLNGKTINSTAYRTIRLKTGADLTVKDSAGGGKIANTYKGSANPATIYLEVAGTKFTLESGAIESDPNETSLQSVAINSEKYKACEVNINGGSVTVPEAATEGRAIVASTNSMTLNIRGGTIAGGLHGVDAYSGSTVNITGGEITARVVDTGVIKEAYGMRLIGTANVTVAGGTITGVKMDDNGYKLDVPTVKLESGTINGSFYSISPGTIIFNVAENATIVLANDSAAKFLPNEVKLVQNSNGTYGVKAGTYVAEVAEVGGKKYESLDAAFAAVQDNETVKLLDDINLQKMQTVSDKTFTLDLNGHNIINEELTALMLAGSTNMTVQDTSEKASGMLYGGYIGIFVTEKATLTVKSGTVKGGTNAVTNSGTVNIEGTANLQRAAGEGVHCESGSITNMTGGTVFDIGPILTMNAKSDVTVKISGGVVENYAYATEVTGGKIKDLTLITGCDISGAEITDSIQWLNGNVPTLTDDVTLGENATVRNEGYCFNSKKTAIVSSVAKIGSTKYATLQEAINATKTGDTVTLLADVNLGDSSVSFYNKKVTSVCNLTFDLNGHTIKTKTLKSGGYAVAASRNGLLIKNGTITNESDKTDLKTCAVYVTGAGTTTFENVTLSAKGSGVYVSLNNGEAIVNVETGTSISGKNGVSLKGATDKSTYNGKETLNVNDGKITGTAAGVYVVGPGSGSKSADDAAVTVNVTGGEVSSVTTESGNSNRAANVTISGGTVTGDLKNAGKDVITISGGTFKGTVKNLGDGSITISGGTFTTKPNETYLAEGYTITQNGDGTYGIKKTTYVAEYNGTQYTSLQEAITAASRNATVKLLADTRENVTIDKAMTLDLNGHTLNGGTEKGKPALTITARTVTIKDSSKAQTGTIMREDTAENSGVSSHYVIDIQGNAWVMFESGTVKNDSGAGGTKGASLVRVGNDSVAADPGLNIKGGTFTQNNFIVIKVDRGTLYLNDGEVNSANSYAIENWHRAIIKGGTVNGTVAAWTYSNGYNSNLEISGGTITGDVTSVNYGNAEGKKATVTITGGTITGQLDTRSYDPKTGELTSIVDAAKATIKVTGGTFDKDPTKYVVEGSTVNTNTDGTFGVEKAYLAKVGETSYYTMDEAFKAQTTSGAPIVMLRDYTTGSQFKSGSINRTVDLDGHTWTYTGTNTNDAAFEINYPNVTLTVKNGTVVSNSMVGLIPSAMGGTITYDNSGLVFEKVEMTANGHSGIETNGNNKNDAVTLKDSTLDVPNGFGIYFPSSGTLTIDKSTINAKTMGVQVCAGSLNINAGSGITVTGDAVPKTENDGAIQDGAAISIVNRTGYKGLGDVTVTGGTFTAKTGNDAIKAYDWANNTATDFTANDKVFVSGGTFSSIPDNMTELCAKDYIPELTPSGAYEVRKADYVAAISDKQYTSLANAIAAAKDGDTVKLLDDVVLDKTLIIKDKTITLDLNGKTISNSVDIWNENTYAWSLISVRDKGNLTIDDTTGSGTLKAKENDCFALDVYAYDTKNVENTKLTINAGNYVGNISAVYAFTGKATINGGHFSIQQKESGSDPYRLTLNCYDSSYTAGRAHITVTGGTFYGFDPANNTAEGEGTSFVPEGYIPKDNNDGSYTVVKGTYVAEYNDTKYTSLQEAIDAASQRNGGQAVVTLLGNLTITETVNFANVTAASVLLDLGGYTLTGENCRALQINKGNLYLENGTVTSTGIDSSKSVIRIGSNEAEYSGISPMLYMRNGAKVLAPKTYGVTLFGSATVKEKLTVAGNASIVATGPSPAISGNGDKAYHVDGKGTEITITGNAVVSAENNYAIYHPDNGTLKIQDSATVSGKGGIQMCSGTLEISYGSPTIKALGKADHETGASGPIYDIAAISVVNRSYPGGAPVVTIKGTPTVTANEGEVIHAYTWSNNAESVWAEAGENINVSGGTYSKTFNTAYLAADCTLVANNDTTYTVKQKPVAEYNGTPYTSLPQALQDARNAGGGEVKLLKDVTQTTSSLDIGKVTLDLNRQTLTLDGGAQLYTSNAATIKNGTIKRTDEPTSGNANDFAIQVMSGSSLTLGATSADTVKIESTYGVYNVGGTLTVSHATITTDGWSVAVSDSKTKTGEVTIGEGAVITSQNGNCIGTMVNSKPNVTITGGRLTSDGTAWDAGVIYWASEGTLTITGGTFTASSAESSEAAAVYQKNGTVKISGNTAKLLGNNALVVQAGDGSTGTMVTELSGGTYSTKPEEAWVVNGYRAIENTDGSFTVVEGKFTVQVTSRTVSSESPVANVSGGGSNITYAEGTTVTAASLSGYKFVGWFVNEYVNDSSTPVKTDLSFSYKPTADCTLIAVYEPISGAKFYLTVNASEFTVGESAVYDSYMHDQVAAGESVTVRFEGKENFLYWVNASRKVVSISKEYTFIMGSETTLTAVYGKTREAQATVVFMSDSDQIITSKAYKSGTAIQFPTPPIKMGCTFTGWSMTEQEIQAAIAASNNGVIVVKARYTDPSTPYTVTVLYPDDTKEEYSGMVGKTVTLTAKEISGKIFSYWTDSENNVLGYAKTLMLAPSGSITVKAVYSDTAVEAKPVITMTAVEAGEVGTGYYVISFTATRAVPEGYTVVKQGILYSVDSQCSGEGAKDYMKLTDEGSVPAGIYVYEGNNTALSGVTRFNAKTGAVDRTIYGRGYMVLKNSSGAMEYVYSDNILSGNYSNLANIGG